MMPADCPPVEGIGSAPVKQSIKSLSAAILLGLASGAGQALAQGYPQGSYSATPPPAAPYAYAQPGYGDYGYGQYPGYGYQTPPTTGTYAYPGAQGYYPPAYGYGMPYGGFPRGFGKKPWEDWDLFGGDNPLQNPLDHEGYWAHPRFQPWRSGPFAHDKWRDHPMKQMPWGNFPGWGDGFFGGYGPDRWKGVTPWGNDVPFKWMDPSDPEESIANMWEDAINTPYNMGRMPPGWTAPQISVPNPIDVENEFERNFRNAPTEFRNMWSEEGAGFGSAGKPKTKKAEKKPKQDPQQKPNAAKPTPADR